MSLLPWLATAAAYGITAATNPTPLPLEPTYKPTQHFRLNLDNDVYFSKDGDYTNGLRFDYARMLESGNFWGISLMQSIYTPYDNSLFNIPGQQAYAGYLALGGAYITRGEQFGTSTEFQLGTTGKSSLAKESQDLIHTIGDMWKYDGWDDQMDGELTIQLSSRQDFNIEALNIASACGTQHDGVLYLKEELGTVSCRMRGGFIYRYGKNLPDRMGNAGCSATNFGINSITKENYKPNENSYFLVLATSIEYVAHDLFVDGVVFHDFEPTCTKKPWIAEFHLGYGMVYHDIDYYIGANLRSDYYHDDQELTLYGTLSIGWNW